MVKKKTARRLYLRTCPFDPYWTREEEAEWARAQEPFEFEPVAHEPTTDWPTLLLAMVFAGGTAVTGGIAILQFIGAM
jgi:hypothetical protein